MEALQRQDTPETNLVLSYLNDLRAKNVVTLGTDEAFALTDGKGQIRAFKQNTYLSNRNGGLIQPVSGSPFVVSAQGYEIWAEAAGASVIFPKEVLVGNEWRPNPFAERDPKNRRILAVHARAVAFKFSSKGIPQVSDWTTIFDTPSYRMIDLLAKAKKTPQAFKLLPADMDPPESKNATWAAYPFDESTKLWLNTSHDEVLTWFAQILNREKKAMDFAQTFAKRNALKHLSGLQKAPGPDWNIPVLCWRPTNGNIIKWDATEYVQLQGKVGGMISGDNSMFESDTPQIEMKQGKENVSDEQGFDNLEAETDPEDQTDVIEVQHSTTKEQSPQEQPVEPQPAQNEIPPQAQQAAAESKPAPEPKSGPEEPPKEISKENKQAQQTQNIFPSDYQKACKELNVSDDPLAVDAETAVKLVRKVSEYMDMQAEGGEA
ncbi:MAG: hypothetical protein GY737_13990 [Desulfobacteraceae bacterium]|nr:hypothetical protein [Desulfobacteraceae bacterium]